MDLPCSFGTRCSAQVGRVCLRCLIETQHLVLRRALVLEFGLRECVRSARSCSRCIPLAQGIYQSLSHFKNVSLSVTKPEMIKQSLSSALSLRVHNVALLFSLKERANMLVFKIKKPEYYSPTRSDTIHFLPHFAAFDTSADFSHAHIKPVFRQDTNDDGYDCCCLV